jgi:DNA polymerase-3 subunit beta
MKLICNGLDLSSAVLTVSKAVSSKTTNPILEGIHLKCVGDNLILTATDTELTIEKTIKADVLMEGETVVTGKMFGDFIKKLEGEQVELSKLDGNDLTIRYADSDSRMQVFSAEEFPKINKDINENYFEIKQADFKSIVDKTVFACATDESRPILKGCLFEIEDNVLTAVALDGFRMSIVEKDVLSGSGNFKAIVPARTLSEITRLLEKDDDLLRISVQKNSLMVSIGTTVLISRLIEGEFIKYRQILPTSFITNVRINKQLLINSIERASVVAKSDKLNIIRFDVKEEFLNISSKSEIGNVNENIAINMDGKDIVIAFNGKYLLDYLKTTDEEFISMNLNSPIDPCVMKPLVNADYTYLLVPVRING